MLPMTPNEHAIYLIRMLAWYRLCSDPESPYYWALPDLEFDLASWGFPNASDID